MGNQSGRALTDVRIRQALPRDKKYKLYDSHGLYVLVNPNGSKYWRLKYYFDGKANEIAFGVYPEVSLKEAREKRDEARRLIRQGINPRLSKRLDRAQREEAARNTYQAVALEFFDMSLVNSLPKYKNRIVNAQKKDVFPIIGDLPLNEITPKMVINVVKRIQDSGRIESGIRRKREIGQVFRFAIASERADRDPTVGIDHATIKNTPKHFASITDPAGVGRLMMAIEYYQGTPTVRAALKLSALFMCRPGELRHLLWSQYKEDESRIEITASKKGAELIIPVCRQAKQILAEQRALRLNSEYILPNARGGNRCMSDNAVRTALRTMGFTKEDMTPHGFRAMARTLLDERQNYPVEWIEQQLAHTVKDPLGRAYNRTKHLNQRIDMMQRWADYLDELRLRAEGKNVVQLPLDNAS